MSPAPASRSGTASPGLLWFYLVSFLALLAWSGWRPLDRLTWFLEVAPALLALPLLIATRRRFPLTSLVYLLIWVHAAILVVGGHYTYAEVPLGHWVKDWLGLARNNYDKLGHLAQGFVPAMVTREVLIRLEVVRGNAWLWTMVTAICLAMSALYELIEWAAAELTGEAAEAFLGTQGYVWDTQSDMALALVGALLAQATLNRLHDRQLARLVGGSRQS